VCITFGFSWPRCSFHFIDIGKAFKSDHTHTHTPPPSDPTFIIQMRLLSIMGLLPQMSSQKNATKCPKTWFIFFARNLRTKTEQQRSFCAEFCFAFRFFVSFCQWLIRAFSSCKIRWLQKTGQRVFFVGVSGGARTGQLQGLSTTKKKTFSHPTHTSINGEAI